MTDDMTRPHDSNKPLPALDEREMNADPFQQFEAWYQAACDSDLPDSTAMTLATASAEGLPSARIVLLKSYDGRGFVFHTNYQSRKALEMTDNPHAALVLYWQPLHRQVRIEGTVEKISGEESDAYFASRPRAARLGAIISAQSGAVNDRAEIRARFSQLEHEREGQDVTRPSNWGGLRVAPVAFEFWQGRDDRLHDRFRYMRQPDDTWRIERLWP